jgi:single-strand DNA-binding protein
MGYLNKVLLIGRLGQEPEKRITPSGHTVVNISLATTEYFKDQGGNKQERTEWHRVVLWNRLAEIVEQYCQKGSQIYVEGSLQTREWQDKDGNRRFSTDITARSIQLLDSKAASGQGGYQQPNASANQSPPNQPNGGIGGPPQQNSGYPDQPSAPNSDEFVEDDIPF